jgi:phage shock protein A
MWLRRLLAPAEDPRQAPAAEAPQRQLALDRLEAALAAIAPVRQQLEARGLQARETIPRLEQQARDALVAGDKSLARRVLERQQHLRWQLATLERQLSELDAEEQRLEIVQQRLVAQFEAARARTALLTARRQAAEAQLDLSDALDESEAESEYLVARADAVESLRATAVADHGVAPDALERAEIDRAVAAQLARLESELKGRAEE